MAEIPLFEWVAGFAGMPLLYLLTGVLNRILSLAAGIVRRKLSRNATLPNPRVLRPPFRLLLLALAIRWLVQKVGAAIALPSQTYIWQPISQTN